VPYQSFKMPYAHLALAPSAIAALAGCIIGSAANAQDSTAVSPGQSDALSPYDASLQRVRYVVDMAPLTSSWGNAFLIAPVLKAPAEIDPLFTTQMGGATSVSADHDINLAFSPRAFARWSGAGVGLHPTSNTPASPANAVTVSSFSRRFALGLTGVSAGATNIVSAVVGQDSSNPSRLFVERTVALCSRPAAASPDTATLALGGITPSGVLALRADGANAKAASPVRQDNLVRVDSAARSGTVVPTLGWSETGPVTSDAGAISYVGANLGVAVTIPALMRTPTTTVTISLDFAAQYLAKAVVRSGSLAPGLSALRGSPAFSTIALPGVQSAGTVASLARSTNISPTDAFNAFGVDSAGLPVPNSARAAVIPAPLSSPGGFTFNAGGRAEFRHYRNQSLFRGPYGHVAIGFDPPTASTALAGVATDPDAAAGGAGEALLVARLSGANTVQWAVAARVGTPVLDGPMGVAVATISAGTPVTFSAPAADRLGNLYFVAAVSPVGGGATTQALLKAVRTPSTPAGYTLERLVQSGQVFTGANSARPITITRLRLADSDSIDSGGFHAGAILTQPLPGGGTTNPASPSAFGGVALNAVITYDAASPALAQKYEATLFIAPAAAPPAGCVGDFNNDGNTNTADLVTFLSRFGQTVTPGATGDLNNDGFVNTLDLTRFLSAFGCVAR
jgi:hypothetical protein